MIISALAYLLIVFLNTCYVNGQATPFSGPTYQSETALMKENDLLNVITQNTSSGTWYNLEEIEMFLESMNLSFTAVADDMPYQFLGLQRRPKLIHSIGVISKAVWTPTPGNPFTGILGKGCQNVLFRLSLATQPGGDKAYTPGISLKCLRNGIPSGNLFAMYSLLGQDSWNFFKHDLTSHVGDFSSGSASFLFNRLRARFAEASNFPTMIGLSDLAKYQEDGSVVENPEFPFRLVFHPIANWHNFFPDSPPTTTFQEQLSSNLKPGPLYQIYAQVSPDDAPTKVIQIGQLDLTTTPTSSYFGDLYLFFQHHRFEDDVVYKPDWGPKALAIMQAQRDAGTYVYPDLPWVEVSEEELQNEL